tara:strand:+ start:1753 stop:2319 length:567 start_codon:yes stop_codon:yes gene_type:complete
MLVVVAVGQFALWERTAPPSRRDITKTKGLEDAWEEGEEGEPPCRWWDGGAVYDGALCSHFAIGRLASSFAAKAQERALECATHFATECVLAAEVGIALPSCFVYAEGEMRMVTAPRILSSQGEATVRVQVPSDPGVSRLVTLNRSVEVEFLLGGSKRPSVETFHNESAWCIQMLREAVAAECWEELD